MTIYNQDPGPLLRYFLEFIEGWFSGKPELRLNVMGSDDEYAAQDGDGNNVMEIFYKPNRGGINSGGHDVEDYLFYWPEAYPEALTFKWEEEDGGVFSQDTENITVKWGSNTYSVTCPEFLKSDHVVCIPGTFWIDRLDVLVEIFPDEEANAGIAVAIAPQKLSGCR